MSGIRLLNIDTFELEDFTTTRMLPKYVILSHRWRAKEKIKLRGEDGFMGEVELEGEVEFEQYNRMDKGQFQTSQTTDFSGGRGIAKILGACQLVRSRYQDDRSNVKYVWIDTCCINKGDKSEENRAINSMFSWYRDAEYCYAFLADVATDSSEYVTPNDPADKNKIGPFEKSEWFKRGWTLQELLASQQVEFVDFRWRSLGDKDTLFGAIQRATGIDPGHLGDSFADASIATKMSWVSRRETTYTEDLAYCMLGIFGIIMETHYGEGQTAFLRLQEALVNKSNDESIFAWTSPVGAAHGLLAPELRCFQHAAGITNDSDMYEPRVGYSAKKDGVEFWIPSLMWDHANGADWNNLAAKWRKKHLLRLNCWTPDSPKQLTVCIELEKQNRQWRRVNCDRSIFSNKAPRSSESPLGAGTRARPMQVPHTT